MRITFNEGWAGVDLAEYFRRSDCLVDQIGRHVVEVNPRQPLLPGAAKLEIEGLLRVWCKLHPGAITTVLPVEQARPLAEPDVLTT